MATEQKSVAEIRTVLADAEKDLILQREATRRFISTDHKAKVTEEYQVIACETEARLERILVDIMEIGVGDDVEAKRLDQQCRDLERYTDAIS